VLNFFDHYTISLLNLNYVQVEIGKNGKTFFKNGSPNFFGVLPTPEGYPPNRGGNSSLIGLFMMPCAATDLGQLKITYCIFLVHQANREAMARDSSRIYP
jgi:hypothetical protein